MVPRARLCLAAAGRGAVGMEGAAPSSSLPPQRQDGGGGRRSKSTGATPGAPGARGTPRSPPAWCHHPGNNAVAICSAVPPPVPLAGSSDIHPLPAHPLEADQLIPARIQQDAPGIPTEPMPTGTWGMS